MNITDHRITEESDDMGSIKQLEIDLYDLAQMNAALERENERLAGDLAFERESHDSCHIYFDDRETELIVEIEELKMDLAHEIEDHVECHRVFESGIEYLDNLAEYWKRSFDELAAHALQLQKELTHTRGMLAVAEFSIDQQNESIDALGVQVVAFANLQADIYDVFADAGQFHDVSGYKHIADGVLASVYHNAPETFDGIEREIKDAVLRRQGDAA
jgi:chromosome segregation ATPase